MEFSDYLTPVDLKLQEFNNIDNELILLNNVSFLKPGDICNFNDYDIAVLGS